jgi:hypothetical protein
MARAFAVGSAVHLTLEEVAEWEWLAPNAIYWVGVGLLALWGSTLGWMLCAVGLVVPLIAFGDQLTQSALLLGYAVAALGCAAGSPDGRAARLDRSFPAAVRLLTTGTYAIAAFHKLNHDFVDPRVSCATGGLDILAANWGFDALRDPAAAHVWPWLFLAAETTVVLLSVARPAAGLILALAMHIPLTIVFAPAFAFVMLVGWSAFFTEDDLRHLGEVLARRWRVIAIVGCGLGLISFGLYMRTHWIVYPWWQLKELLLWLGLAWLATAFVRRPPGVLSWWGAYAEGVGPRGALVVALGVLWAANGVLPYTGLTFHHSGAMLSNLRIDAGCWNSMIVPEAVRLVDPYVRIDVADVPEPSADAAPWLERVLWNRRSLTEAREELCRRTSGPIAVRGTFRGRSFAVEDVCADWLLGDDPLPGVARYQANLIRECPQACIH